MCVIPVDKAPTHVSLGQRYSSAWSEINARIQSRQTANLYFAVASVAAASYIIGKFFEKDPLELPKETLLIVASVGLVALSWVYVLWIRHNDAIIGLLSTYCKTVEQLDNPNNDNKFPAWHDERQGLIVQAREYRKLSDWATIALVLLSTIPSISIAYKSAQQPCYMPTVLLVASSIAGVLACNYVYQNFNIRKSIAEIKFQIVDGEWKFSDFRW